MLTDEASISRIKPEMGQELSVSTEDAEKINAVIKMIWKVCNTNREASIPLVHTV